MSSWSCSATGTAGHGQPQTWHLPPSSASSRAGTAVSPLGRGRSLVSQRSAGGMPQGSCSSAGALCPCARCWGCPGAFQRMAVPGPCRAWPGGVSAGSHPSSAPRSSHCLPSLALNMSRARGHRKEPLFPRAGIVVKLRALGPPSHSLPPPSGISLETGRRVGHPVSPKRAPLGCPARLWGAESPQPAQSFVPSVTCAVSDPPGLTHTRRGGGGCRNGWKYLIIHVGHRDYSHSSNICTTGRRLAGLGHPR